MFAGESTSYAHAGKAKPEPAPRQGARQPASKATAPVQLSPHWHGMATHVGSVQTKLSVGAANDEYEQEADAVADQVMRMPASSLDDSAKQRLPLLIKH